MDMCCRDCVEVVHNIPRSPAVGQGGGKIGREGSERGAGEGAGSLFGSKIWAW